MKRFHVHVSVTNLADGIGFYSAVFGAEPSVRKEDYAKWMLEDPPVNFAISARGGANGVDHLGFQVESSDELEAMRARLSAADAKIFAEKGADCCYARSDKYWVTDPAGIAWESFHTLANAPTYGSDAVLRVKTTDSACCAPGAAATKKAACCG